MNFDKKVACGEFVKRQTLESGYSHFEGDWKELEQRAAFRMGDAGRMVPGYRDGVILVDVYENPPANQFYSAIVKLDESSKLTANYTPRRDGEAPFIRVSAKAKKQVANHASVVLYRHDVLDENNERETNAEWEIVAIKARVDVEEEPMHYYTMCRNFLHLEGGTQGNFSADDFAKSILYWNEHAMLMGKPRWYRKLLDFWSAIFG